MIKTRPQKPKTTSQLVKELDTVFAEFIKLRDADYYGTVRCFATGERVFYREADAAHWRPRQYMGTRWDERNVHACTVQSNRYDAGHSTDYQSAMLKKYSLKELQSISDASKSTMKFTAFELQEKIVHYSEEVKKLRALKKI